MNLDNHLVMLDHHLDQPRRLGASAGPLEAAELGGLELRGWLNSWTGGLVLSEVETISGCCHLRVRVGYQ